MAVSALSALVAGGERKLRERAEWHAHLPGGEVAALEEFEDDGALKKRVAGEVHDAGCLEDEMGGLRSPGNWERGEKFAR